MVLAAGAMSFRLTSPFAMFSRARALISYRESENICSLSRLAWRAKGAVMAMLMAMGIGVGKASA